MCCALRLDGRYAQADPLSRGADVRSVRGCPGGGGDERRPACRCVRGDRPRAGCPQRPGTARATGHRVLPPGPAPHRRDPPGRAAPGAPAAAARPRPAHRRTPARRRGVGALPRRPARRPAHRRPRARSRGRARRRARRRTGRARPAGRCRAPSRSPPAAATARRCPGLARPPDRAARLALVRPLDAARFEAAWQAVCGRESVLRTGFVWDPRPRAVVFDHGPTDVVRHPHHTVIRRAALLARERARGFDLRRPGAARVALLDSGPADAAAPFTEVIVTYHRALLDSWSVRLLMRECCRAYLADGVLPGGERRPDLGDCARWLRAQGVGPADGCTPVPAHRSAVRAVPRPGPHRPAGSAGTGVLRTALTPDRSAHLAHWAAHWGVAESSVLQAVWAMLLYRASDAAPGRATVGFGLDFPGRGLLLEGIEGVPGPFENALPVTVDVDATRDLPGLLRELRDLVMDMAACEWGASGGAAPGRDRGTRAGGLLAFDCGPRAEAAYGTELAAHGIRVEEQEAAGAPAGYALRLRAGHDARRGLVLTCVYDPGLVDGGAARTLLAHTVRLLRLLPGTATAGTTVGDVLAWLPDAVMSPVPDGPPAPEPAPLVPLRGALAPEAATVCLLDVPGAPRTGHWELVRHYQGPEALTALRLTAARGGRPGRGPRQPGPLGRPAGPRRVLRRRCPRLRTGPADHGARDAPASGRGRRRLR
ncbi:condensation domain-containing protein [Streptomyces lasalocidi]